MQSEKIFQYPPVPFVGVEDSHDLALIKFNQQVLSEFATMSFDKPKAGDPVTLIGYGSCTEFLGPKNTFGRCVGENVVETIDKAGSVVTLASKGVSLTKGDSGGPILNADDNIFAVANRASIEKSFHTGFFTSTNKNWLKKTIESNSLEVCGVTMDSCDSQTNPIDNQESSVKAQKIAIELMDSLTSASKNCTFQIKGTLQNNEGDRFIVNIRAKINKKDTLDFSINFSVSEQSHGKEIFKKMKVLNKLSNIEGCDF